MFLLFVRFLPVIAAAEVKSVLPEADPHAAAHPAAAHPSPAIGAQLAVKGAH
jgi:molybdopterin-containing oxidoreductase family membrane subunit